MKYEAFGKKVLKEIRKTVFDNRIDKTEVLETPFKERFKVELGSRTGLNIDPDEILCITDTTYDIVDANYNLYKVYEKVKSGEISKQEGIKEGVTKAEEIVQGLVVCGQHYFDKINAQEKFDKEHGIETDYSKWYRQ